MNRSPLELGLIETPHTFGEAFPAFLQSILKELSPVGNQHYDGAMGTPEPKPFPEPFPEPEKPWPIDPRPAIRELKAIGEDIRTHGFFREQTPQQRRRIFFGTIVVVSMLSARYWIDRIYAPPAPTRYVSEEQVSKIKTGMTQKQVLYIFGSPRPSNKGTSCWVYDLSDNSFVEVHFGSLSRVTVVNRTAKRRSVK